jgi:hypothetical protein
MLAHQLPGLTRPRRSLAAAVAVAALAAPLAVGRASSGAQAAVRPVSYRGYSFEVPRSWPVIDLAGSRQTCVRFDMHAVYLGDPASDQSCPSSLVGRTEAVLIQPAPASPARSSVEDPVARQITVTAPGIEVTATFDTDPGQVDQILASASLPVPVVHAPNPATAATVPAAGPGGPAPVPLASFSMVLTSLMLQAKTETAAVPPLSAMIANYRGLGFDACTAPSAAYMSAWLRKSPYRAVGVYIGGSDEACAQPNLTRKWLEAEAAAGWHFIPTYVGPQAEFGELGAHPRYQGRAAAIDAVAQAERLGFGAGTPLYYDMEAYPPGEAGSALRFLSAWTSRIHALGYSSGVYSSSSAAVAALARQYSTHRYALPDVIFDALWNGAANTADPVLTANEWADHQRVHQFAGNIALAYGGDAINIDQDYLNVQLSGPDPASPADENGRGTADAFFRGTGGRPGYLSYPPGWGWVNPVR